jgi:hypothetical protein
MRAYRVIITIAVISGLASLAALWQISNSRIDSEKRAPKYNSVPSIKTGPNIRLETVEADAETGRVSMVMSVEVREFTQEIVVSLVGDSSLVPGGIQKVRQPVGDQTTVEFKFTFEIPQNDTLSVMFFVLEETGIEGSYSRTHVVRRGNSVDTIHLASQQVDDLTPVGSRWFIRRPDTLLVLNAHPDRSWQSKRIDVPTRDAR